MIDPKKIAAGLREGSIRLSITTGLRNRELDAWLRAVELQLAFAFDSMNVEDGDVTPQIVHRPEGS